MLVNDVTDYIHTKIMCFHIHKIVRKILHKDSGLGLGLDWLRTWSWTRTRDVWDSDLDSGWVDSTTTLIYIFQILHEVSSVDNNI